MGRQEYFFLHMSTVLLKQERVAIPIKLISAAQMIPDFSGVIALPHLMGSGNDQKVSLS